jgi:peptidoglycan/xylan/chitin deacetylase (PgdA/CDA1 family)
MNLRRENWQEYVTFLRSLYRQDAILQEYDRDRILMPARRGEHVIDEVSGAQFPPKTLLLTFDDGPHQRYTGRILEILKKYEVGSVFFQVGTQLGTVGQGGKVQLGPKAGASRQVLLAGGVLANHSYTHPVLSQLNSETLNAEIANTNALLKQVSGISPVLFRPPYGARNEAVLARLKQLNMKSILWNIDSKDWADPVPGSIAGRVLEEVEREGRGIILFHDIHERTIEALEMILESLSTQGYRFAAWDGKDFVAPLGTTVAKATAPATSLYRESWAVIVGIDEYEKWTKLRYAVNDAKAVRDMLVNKYGFKPENVFSLHNAEATRNNILSVLGDTLGNPERVKHDDRVFVFFAGHGATRQLASGRDLGYLVPVDAGLTNYHGQAISMTNFRDIAEAIPAKHVFFVMDSCYSGLGLTRGGATTPAYLQELTRRNARQILTAGGADQQVSDSGPNGHSVFTWTLLQALEGRADLNNDGYVTASELATYTLPLVASLAPQTPAFGSLPGSEGGEFVFELKPNTEFLSDLSQQLDDQSIRLNSRLDQLRVDIVKKRERNQQLKKEIAAANKKLAGAAMPVEATVPAEVTAATHNDRGLAL